MRYRTLLTLTALSLILLVVAACGGQTQTAAPKAVAQPTTAPAQPTTVPAQPTAAAPKAAATAVPAAPTAAAKAAAPTTAPASAPTTAPAAATGAPKAAAPAPGASRLTLRLEPTASEARFRVQEQFANQTVKVDAVGTTKAVSGQIVLDQDGKVVKDQSKFTVDLTTLKSDEGRRDNFIRQNTLETAKFPTAEFVPTEVKGLPSPLPRSGDVTFQLVGDMTVKSVTKPITWDVTGKIDGNTLTGQAKTTFKFGDFGMAPPRVPILAAVADDIRLEFDYKMTAQ